jgi:hypothetical protein
MDTPKLTLTILGGTGEPPRGKPLPQSRSPSVPDAHGHGSVALRRLSAHLIIACALCTPRSPVVATPARRKASTSHSAFLAP